jgi:putative methyltransferase (TIGR04325 family)
VQAVDPLAERRHVPEASTSMSGRLESVRKAVEEAGPVRSLRGAYYTRQFVRRPGTFSGIYQSFAQATAAAPAHHKLGYDHSELAELYADRHHKVLPSDYPVMFWLERIFETARSIFDFGGHVGVQFYSYQKYLDYPDELRWTVMDVPAIMERGRAIAQERGATKLSFATDFADVAKHDVFFASGSLQYLEAPLVERLEKLERLPRHLLLNKTPLTDGDPFVTLQNIVHAFCPYAIFNRRAFTEPLFSLGYELVDSWETPDMTCMLPLNPERSVAAYSGLYLRLADWKA